MIKKEIPIDSITGIKKDYENSYKEAPTVPKKETAIPVTDIYEEISVEHVDVQAVIVPSISDHHGRLSDNLDTYAKKYDIAVIPLAITNILSEVQSLQRYELLVFNNERYASSNTVRPAVVTKYKDLIYSTIQDGLVFNESLWVSVPAENGGFIQTLGLSKTEWSLLCSMYRRYNAKMVYSKDTNDVRLRVGV